MRALLWILTWDLWHHTQVSYTLESVRQFLGGKRPLSEALYSIWHGCACRLHVKAPTELPAEPNVCLTGTSESWESSSITREMLSPTHQGPWARAGHSEADSRWNSGFLGSGLLRSPVPGPFLCLQRGLAFADTSSSCRSAPLFFCDVCVFQPRGLFTGHNSVRIFTRENYKWTAGMGQRCAFSSLQTVGRALGTSLSLIEWETLSTVASASCTEQRKVAQGNFSHSRLGAVM